jgi:hypothetical protein
MENKLTNKLIVVLGAIVFSFALTGSVQASYVTNYAYSTDPVGYEYQPMMPYYQQPVVNNPIYPQYYQQPQQPQYTYQQPVVAAKPAAQVVNNYYYQTAPKTATTTTTNTTSTNPTYIPANTSSIPANTPNAVPSNNLGASAYNPYAQTGNGITALSLRGSGSFMPSSIWQWILVIILILAIIVIARMFVHKPTPGEHATH